MFLNYARGMLFSISLIFFLKKRTPGEGYKLFHRRPILKRLIGKYEQKRAYFANKNETGNEKKIYIYM